MPTREELIGAVQLPTETVQVKGLNCTIRAITAKGRNDLFAEARGEGGTFDDTAFRFGLVAMCLVDDDGKQMFSMDDLEILQAFPPKEFDALFAAAQRVCGLSKADIEDAEKN